jgi:VCBS repeat-containing protein
VSITVTGVDDKAIHALNSVYERTVTEDTNLSSSGNLRTSGRVYLMDIDVGDPARFVVPASNIDGEYGALKMFSNGLWTYAANNTQEAIQKLGAGDTLTDRLTFGTSDGGELDVVITINGKNDLATIVGGSTAALIEDVGDQSANGALEVNDADEGEEVFEAVDEDDLNGNYGTFTFDDETGEWTYMLNEGAQAIGAGATVTDSLVVKSVDGTASQTITVTITGTNDVPTLSATTTASGSEDAASITVNVAGTDVDNATLAYALVGTPAGFSINSATGLITYTPGAADNALAAGASATRTASYTVSDGVATVTGSVTVTVISSGWLASPSNQ